MVLRWIQAVVGLFLFLVVGSGIFITTATSDLFIKPIHYEVINDHVVAVRQIPLGSVYAEWGDQVTFLPNVISDRPDICVQLGSSLYEKKAKATSYVPIKEWFLDCDVSRTGTYLVKSWWCVKPFHDVGVGWLERIRLACVEYQWDFYIEAAKKEAENKNATVLPKLARHSR